MSGNDSEGPPADRGPPARVEERRQAASESAATRREEERRELSRERLRDSVDWEAAPDWARLLYLEIQALDE